MNFGLRAVDKLVMNFFDRIKTVDFDLFIEYLQKFLISSCHVECYFSLSLSSKPVSINSIDEA